MVMAISQVITYSTPAAIPRNRNYSVRVRTQDGEWKDVDVLIVKVDMHNVREAALAQFDFSGTVEVEVVCHRVPVNTAAIRPLSTNIAPSIAADNRIQFTLDQPCKLSIEINGNCFNNLHLIARAIEQRKPDPNDPGVALIEPAIHRIEDLNRKLVDKRYHTIYFKPGMHHVEQVLVNIPSGKQIYLAGGAFVAGSFVCDKTEDVSIVGRGTIYLAEFGRFSAFRGVRLMYAKNIEISGVSVIDPPHYSVYIGQSEQVQIRDFFSFSTRGWSDGIDMMSSCDIEIDDVFMRNSDDCIAIYGHRWGYYGDTRNITVRNSVLWADVAHPTMIGTHGEHSGRGDVIDNIQFENIDILEHHEPQEGYQGCMTINAGDNNTVRNVTYNDIRIEPFELGRIIDLRVMWNKDYNPVPGNRIENIHFRNIHYQGSEDVESRIIGFDSERVVDGVIIEDFYMNERKITDAESGNVRLGEFVHNVTIR